MDFDNQHLEALIEAAVRAAVKDEVGPILDRLKDIEARNAERSEQYKTTNVSGRLRVLEQQMATTDVRLTTLSATAQDAEKSLRQVEASISTLTGKIAVVAAVCSFIAAAALKFL